MVAFKWFSLEYCPTLLELPCSYQYDGVSNWGPHFAVLKISISKTGQEIYSSQSASTLAGVEAEAGSKAIWAKNSWAQPVAAFRCA